ncbi:helix-turn-helix transcriptional regulator [Paenibacillus amylolyticus]|uniref:helix-turn-helix domain-containing protein n=1 Tax=Paenibacillus TaxID=44249 RepID=UPI00249C947D|nr:helix-turn-helix transcriptional regulator [Paenibacillus amylolyticus]WFA87635.1 helix-turn-helix transcriptional regulator [Paenibacillus amylolyticus]
MQQAKSIDPFLRSFKPLERQECTNVFRKASEKGSSSATMAKLNTNEYVSLDVIDKLCTALGYQPGDLLEHIADQ